VLRPPFTNVLMMIMDDDDVVEPAGQACDGLGQ